MLDRRQKAGEKGGAAARPYHIVQISFDDAVFSSAEDPEPLLRQVRYGRVLATRAPGSHLSIIVVTRKVAVEPLAIENLTLHPVPGPAAGPFVLFRALRALHRGRPIDVITTQTIALETAIALVFARWYGCRVVGQIHYDAFSFSARRNCRWGRLRHVVFKRLLRYLFAVRTVGTRTADTLRGNRLHWNVHVIPVPVGMLIDPACGEPRAVGRRVLFVGRLAPEKGLDDWLNIAAEVLQSEPAAVFEIVGDGPLRAEIQEMAERLGLTHRVRFMGRIPNSRLGERYREARLLLLTSRHEGFGRVAVEALANQIPVVAPRITGLEDIVEHGRTGFLHEPGDLHGMARSVLLLLRDPDMARDMGRKGRADTLERFQPDALAERWVDLLLSAALPRIEQLVLPRARTFSRWRKIAWSRYTLLRSLEYEAICGLKLAGRTLDIGGGARASYHTLLEVKGESESVNIDAEMKPTVVANINVGLPFATASFDNVISFNTLEHIRDDECALREMFRVLRPGGAFHLIVPFLYQIHGSPSDYHRHTIYWWIDYLLSIGIRRDAFFVEPLVWDRISSAYSFVGHGRVGLLLKRLVTLPAVVGDCLRGRRGRLQDVPRTRSTLDLALGYYIHGVR